MHLITLFFIYQSLVNQTLNLHLILLIHLFLLHYFYSYHSFDLPFYLIPYLLIILFSVLQDLVILIYYYDFIQYFVVDPVFVVVFVAKFVDVL